MRDTIKERENGLDTAETNCDTMPLVFVSVLKLLPYLAIMASVSMV
jgi:hypothetical protein